MLDVDFHLRTGDVAGQRKRHFVWQMANDRLRPTAAASTVCFRLTRGGASARAMPPVSGGNHAVSTGSELVWSVNMSATVRPACCSAKA
jgi:hypothetical protein